jgi:hypothetical protein
MKWHRASDPNKLNPRGMALLILFAVHFCTIIAINCGLNVTEPYRSAWVCGIMIPMIVARVNRGRH